MTEAWLFADPRGPANNGVPGSEPVRLEAGVDPEQFETDDEDYSTDDGDACTRLNDRNQRRRENRRAPWVLAPQSIGLHCRERHPKAYLEWLCRDPRENNCTRWQESKQGAEALAKLDWVAALSNTSHCTWLRAFVEDLAEGLGEPLPDGIAGGQACPLTSYKRDHPSALLRNL